MGQKILISLILSLLVLLAPLSGVSAKKVVKKAAKTSVVVSPTVARNKQSVYLYLANLQKTKQVTYSLSYTTNGKSEGAGGTITTKGKYSLGRTLLFGTCSAGVCRYHKKIKKAVLTVTITFQNGTSITRTFNLRV